jgi:hypothetical protein
LSNKIIFSIIYITNFQPNIIADFNNIKLFKIKKKNRIICRNFFLFLLLLKYFKKNNFFNISLFIKPFKKKLFTILRAPYRHKLTRHQLSLNRFKVTANVQLISTKIVFSNEKSLLSFLSIINKLYM